MRQLSRLLDTLGRMSIAIMLGMALSVLAEAQSPPEPPKAPTCEEREAIVRAYAGESDRLLTYLRTRLAETEAALRRAEVVGQAAKADEKK